MASGWSKLDGYLLGLILEKLDLVAHVRFASVCWSWRSVAVENPPINKPLYMALSHEPEHLVRRFIATFAVPSWKEARFIGALDGWLAILIDGRDLFLLNKGFNSIIPLPPPPPEYPKNLINRRPFYFKAVLSSPPSSSSGECTVVINHLYDGVFYCRLGLDKSFNKLPDIKLWPEDILFYKGRLYVLCFPNTIVIFDHLLNKVSQSSVTHLADNLIPRRLLILGNDVPAIVAGDSFEYFVFTLEGSEPRLVRVNDTGDNFQILLSNRYCSLSVPTKEHKEFRREVNFFEDDASTIVVDTSKDPNKVKAGDPWPLFFVMFSHHGIKNPVTLRGT